MATVEMIRLYNTVARREDVEETNTSMGRNVKEIRLTIILPKVETCGET